MTLLTYVPTQEKALLKLAEMFAEWAEDPELPLALREKLGNAILEIKGHYLGVLANPDVVWLMEKSTAAEAAKLRDQSAFLYFNGGPAAKRGPKPIRFRPVKWMTSKAQRCGLIEKALNESFAYLSTWQPLEWQTLLTKSMNSTHTVQLHPSSLAWLATSLNGQASALQSEGRLALALELDSVPDG
jgi:hypothetical protein